jgi:hypothetical protein
MLEGIPKIIIAFSEKSKKGIEIIFFYILVKNKFIIIKVIKILQQR